MLRASNHLSRSATSVTPLRSSLLTSMAPSFSTLPLECGGLPPLSPLQPGGPKREQASALQIYCCRTPHLRHLPLVNRPPGVRRNRTSQAARLRDHGEERVARYPRQLLADQLVHLHLQPVALRAIEGCLPGGP